MHSVLFLFSAQSLSIPVEGFIQIFTVAATSALADITLTATERIIWLWRLQLLPLHYGSLKKKEVYKLSVQQKVL